ncbi:hypothetical protein M8J76_012001 [Diaphorina citri]|nr:hypothetical protein M8J76_012001 [Diaphorina citri]
MSREQEIIRNILDELLDGNDSDFSDLDDSRDEDELTLAVSTSETEFLRLNNNLPLCTNTASNKDDGISTSSGTQSLSRL